MPDRSPLIKNIQALRAFAALNVVLLHVLGEAAVYGPHPRYLAFLGIWGACGVDIFFVISGFVMVYTQYHKPRTATEFLDNRVRRIVPIYWILTFAIIAIYLIAPTNFQHTTVTPGRALQSLLFITGLLGTSPLLFLGWTLELEMLFYLVFAMGILMRDRMSSMIFCAAALIGLALMGTTLPLEFMLGMGIAMIFIRHPRLPIGWLSFATGSVLLLASILLTPHIDQLTRLRVLIWGVPAALIVLGAVYMPQAESRIVMYLGAASYSIYLAQVFAISAFYKIVAPRMLFVQGDVMAVLCLAGSAVAGCLVYEILEKRSARLLKRHGRASDGSI